MGRIYLLRRLAPAIKVLLVRTKGALNRRWVKVFGVLALLWSFFRIRFRARGYPKSKRDDLPRPPGNANDHGQEVTNHDDRKEGARFTTTGNFTTNNTAHEIVPLDSSISCSLHPYPYIHNEKTRSSHSSIGAARAARSAHSQAVATHQASQSSHNLGRPRLGLEPWRVRSPQATGDEYTFTFKSPDQPNSPVQQYRTPHRGYSMSSPDLGTSSTNPNILALERETSKTTSSSDQSIEILDPEGISDQGEGDSGGKPQLFHQRIFPLPPDFFTRYENVKYAEDKETELVIKSMTFDFKTKPDPPGWKPILHPEGVLYWYNEEKKAVTENDLYDVEYLGQITDDLATFDEFLLQHKIQLPPNVTLAFEMTRDADTGTITTDYYYADHDRRIVFFLDEYEVRTFKISQEVKGVASLAHIKHELEAQYWTHVMLYPSTLPNLQDAASEMKDLVFHYIADATSSAFSTAPFDLDELYKLLSVSNDIKKISPKHQIGAASFVSRTMFAIARQKFYNWYGVPQRRLYRDQSVHGKAAKRTWLIKLLSPLLFSAPDVHLNSLHKMWVDGLMHNTVWMKSIKKLNDDWQEFILYATVLLNANVAFIAIQSIDTHEDLGYRSPVQVASYLSIVASIGAIIIGLLLVRQNRTRAHGTATDVCTFLKERSHPTLGLETLAILYSLPYAMLMWGMVSFLAAFAWHCFDLTNAATRGVMGAAWVIFAALVAWCIWMGWVHGELEADEVPVGEAPGNDSPAEECGDTEDEKHLPAPAPPRPDSRVSGKSAKSRASHHSVIGAVAVDAKKKWRWNLNSFTFWHFRRTSLDSQRTQV